MASPPPLKAGSVKHRRLQGSAHQKQEAKKKQKPLTPVHGLLTISNLTVDGLLITESMVGL